MNTDSTFKTAVMFFLVVLLGSLLSAAIGGGFGAIIALISPQWFPAAEGGIGGAISLGLIVGLFIGAGVACFVCFLAAIIKILRIRHESRQGQQG